MNLNSRLARMLAAFLFVLTVASFAWANGEDFFTPPVENYLYYFGHIKDKTGKVLDDVTVNITVKGTPIKFSVRNDTPGHFRTPDVGKAIIGYQEAKGQAINPDNIEITVTKDGYRQVTPSSNVAPKPKGTSDSVAIEFVMEPVAASASK